MVKDRDRRHDTTSENLIHGDGFDDYNAGSLRQGVVLREQNERREQAVVAQQAMLSSMIFQKNMTGVGDAQGLRLSTFIAGIMTAAGHPPTKAQAEALAALDGPAAQAGDTRPGHTATSFATNLLGDANSGITMPRNAFGAPTSVSAAIARIQDIIGAAEAESDADGMKGYHRVNGLRTIPLTTMTFAEVREWQSKQPNSAVGRYQFLDTTLAEGQKELGIPDSALFSVENQRRLMLNELRKDGLYRFLDGKISADNFLFNIAGTWAGIEAPNGEGRYDRMHGNRAKDGTREAMQDAISDLRLAALRHSGPAPMMN